MMPQNFFPSARKLNQYILVNFELIFNSSNGCGQTFMGVDMGGATQLCHLAIIMFICLYVGLTSRHRDVPARYAPPLVESKQLVICFYVGLTSRHRDVPARYAPPLVECLYVYM